MLTPSFQATATERVLPKLALDFTTASLDPRITFTRSLNTATRINSSGYVEVVNANLPRFDYDPVTLACRGLLVEESRTNSLTYSNDFSSGWTFTGSSRGTVATTAPDASANSVKITEDTSTGGHRTYQSFSVTSGTVYTYSAYVKQAGRPKVLMYVSNISTGPIFDLTNGTQQGTVSSGTASIFPAGNGWYRCVYTFTATSTASSRFELWCTTSGGNISYTGDGTSGLYIYGAQLETGAFATSYIPTAATAPITRNADSAIMSGSNFTSWYNGSEGSYAVTSLKTDYWTAVGGSPIEFSASTVANRQGLSTTAFTTTSTPQIYSINTSAFQYNQTINGAITAQPTTVSASYKANQFNGAASKISATQGTSGTPPTVDRCNIGSIVAGLGYFNGHIQKVRYWPQVFSTRETQAFSG